MKEIHCSGSPHEIGFAHGSGAAVEIARGIAFYESLFKQKSDLNWTEVKALSSDFNDTIQAQWPRYYEELQGISSNHDSRKGSAHGVIGVAQGAERDILDIVALNVRSEIVFGQFSDGCTSLFCRGEKYTFMGQNWDAKWMEEQAPNLVNLTIVQESLPSIKMVTEAGIIGKIGLNSEGVAVCFNAIRAHGITKGQMPCHLGLRLALESASAEEAAASLEAIGMASSGHFLIGDAETAIGLEFTSKTFARVPVNESNFLVHSNHLLLDHPDVFEPRWLDDSPMRLETLTCSRTNRTIHSR
ncbi:hypothetical protein FSARC_14434 [Fusarium sarcochroum]|uniref:Peptidase C45 hydrolase domain-containing protein n=1 Tax=Fusarium sarcochroum TaxID=1208366 RepID=A0A8H4WP05_9HYPO|nr:hypothetical protein FSARC_14434 [Fusarium sarcochroum]